MSETAVDGQLHPSGLGYQTARLARIESLEDVELREFMLAHCVRCSRCGCPLEPLAMHLCDRCLAKAVDEFLAG